MATFKTAYGHFNLSTTNASLVDWSYDKIIDYDDETKRGKLGFADVAMVFGESEEIGTPEFYCFAGEFNPRTGTFNNGTVAIATDTTNIIVTSTDGIRVDDILHVATAAEDGEHLRVTAVGTNNVTVERINTTPATINTSATFTINGGASSELATAGITATYMEPEKVTNRCQLIRRAVSLSETEDASDVVAGGSRAADKMKQCRTDFRLDLGHTFWFGISTSSASGTYTTTKGLNEQLAGNAAGLKINVGGALAMANLSGMMEALLPYAATDVFDVWCGSKALGGLVDLGAAAAVGGSTPKSEDYGSAAQSVRAGDFTFRFMFERIFEIVGAPYNAYAYFVSKKAYQLKHLKGRKLIVQTNTKATPLSEIVTTQYKTHSGIALTWAKRCGFLYGIT